MTKLTATQKLARLHAEAAKSGPCCSLWSRGIDCMCADAAELDVDTEDVDYVEETQPVEFHQTKLYDRTECQAMFVLGTTPDGFGIVYRFENDAPDQEREVGARRLRTAGRYVAVCRHYYGVMDSCPNCDAAEDTEAQRQELTRQANEATPDPVDSRIDSITPGWSEGARDFVARSVRYLSPSDAMRKFGLQLDARQDRVRPRPLTLAEYLVKVGTGALRQAARDARC